MHKVPLLLWVQVFCQRCQVGNRVIARLLCNKHSSCGRSSFSPPTKQLCSTQLPCAALKEKTRHKKSFQDFLKKKKLFNLLSVFEIFAAESKICLFVCLNPDLHNRFQETFGGLIYVLFSVQ